MIADGSCIAEPDLGIGHLLFEEEVAIGIGIWELNTPDECHVVLQALLSSTSSFSILHWPLFSAFCLADVVVRPEQPRLRSCARLQLVPLCSYIHGAVQMNEAVRLHLKAPVRLTLPHRRHRQLSIWP